MSYSPTFPSPCFSPGGVLVVGALPGMICETAQWTARTGTRLTTRMGRPVGEVYMSLDVLNQVWAADMAFLRDMYLLNAEYFRFVWGLLQQSEAAEPATAALAAHAGTKVGTVKIGVSFVRLWSGDGLVRQSLNVLRCISRSNVKLKSDFIGTHFERCRFAR